MLFFSLVVLAIQLSRGHVQEGCVRLELLMSTKYDGSVFPSSLTAELGETVARKLLVVHADLGARAVREDYFHLGNGRGSAYDSDPPERHHTTLTDYVRQETALLMRRSTREHAFAPATCIVVPADDEWREPSHWIEMLHFKGMGAVQIADLVPGLESTGIAKAGENQTTAHVKVETWLLPATRRSSISTLLAEDIAGDEEARVEKQGVLLHLGIETNNAAAANSGAAASLPAERRPGPRPALADLLRRLIRVDVPSRGSNYTVLSASLLPACPGAPSRVEQSAADARAGADAGAGELSWLFEPEDDLFTLGHSSESITSDATSVGQQARQDGRIRCAAAVGASSALRQMMEGY